MPRRRSRRSRTGRESRRVAYAFAAVTPSCWSSSSRASTRWRSSDGTTIRYAPPSEPPTIKSSATRERRPDPAGQLSVAEAVARAAHRQDQLGLLGVPLDLLAQVPDMDVDRAWLAVVGAPADPLQQLPPAEDDPGIGGEEREQLELDERQLHGLPRTSTARRGRSITTSPRSIDLVAPAGMVRRCSAAQEGADAAAELADRERLGDVVVRAELEPEHLVELVVPRRQHDDRDGALRAQPPAHLEPVDAGKHDVEHDEVDRLLAEPPERLVAVARLHDPIPVPLERVREQR